jgi:hypothetical protein
MEQNTVRTFVRLSLYCGGNGPTIYSTLYTLCFIEQFKKNYLGYFIRDILCMSWVAKNLHIFPDAAYKKLSVIIYSEIDHSNLIFY